MGSGRVTPWWRGGVVYQIYPRSYRDTNDDGIGDLRGIIGALDYLEWLGVDGLWLNPVTASPDDDWGYDVSDYTAVHPDLGSMDDLEELIAAANSRGIKIVLDFVPNHTSSRHPWFVDARSSRAADHRDWYVWADGRPDESPPNNWKSVFGGSAWEWHEGTGQYYLHNFLDSQADLNWWNEDVRRAMDDVLRFWFEKGVAGFRIDVAHAVVKDEELRDNLPLPADAHEKERFLGQDLTYNMNRPEVHDVIRRWREVAASYDPERVLIGETYVLEVARMARFYGTGDELHLAFNFPFVFAPFEAKAMQEIVELTLHELPEHAWPAWAGSNHDVLRFPSRWCGDHSAKTKVALVMLLTLPGTPFLYYGDELGMPNTPLRYEQLLDPVGKRLWPDDEGRDSCRTPMHWSPGDGAGFTGEGVTPWLPFGDHGAVNVADQRVNPSSPLRLTKDLIESRRRLPDLVTGIYVPIGAPDDVWAYRRGESTTVVLNFSEEPASVEDVTGEIVLCTTRTREGERAEGALLLDAHEAAVLTLAQM